MADVGGSKMIKMAANDCFPTIRIFFLLIC